MDRRAFLRILGIGAAAIAATPVINTVSLLDPTDPESFLWTPGTVSLFDMGDIPHSNDFLTINLITEEALQILQRNLTFLNAVDREYDEAFRVGSTVTIRKPQRYLVRTSRILVPAYNDLLP